MAQVVVGKIASVVLENFVTFDSVVVEPNEHLNIILGPNGSGKSAIVAGIVLGMGGSCKLISRCDSIDGFIKNGKDKATIRISLYHTKRREVRWFSRSFDHNRNNTFLIDNEKVTQAVYMNQIRSYNIQVDNLCQVLAQDRVQDFTKMNPCELLLNTQASVCTPEVVGWLNDLKQKRNAQKLTASEGAESASRVQELEARIANLEDQLESIRVRNEFKQQIEVCQARKLWLEYEQLFLQYNEMLKDHKLAKKATADKEIEYNRFKTAIESILAQKKALEKSKSDQVLNAQQNTDKINALEETSEHLEDALRQQKRGLLDVLAKADERRNELEDAKVVLGAFVQDCADVTAAIGSREQLQTKMQSLETAEAKIRGESEMLLGRRQELNEKIENDLKPEMTSIMRNIESIENVEKKRLRILQTRFEGTYKALMWLREHKHLFQGKIYEPVIMELNVPVLSNVVYLENTIGVRDLIAFTCELTEDMNLFLRKTREELRFEGVNAFQSDPATELRYKGRHSMESLQGFGFHTFLIDMIQGPFPVLNGLCKLYNLQNIPAGSQEVARHVSSLPDDINLFFSPTNRFQVTRSRYTGEKSSRSDMLRKKELLNVSTDQAALEEKRRQLEVLVRQCDKVRNQRGAIENSIKELQDRCAELREEKRGLHDQLATYNQTKLKVQRQQQKCTDLTKRLVDVDEERTKFAQACNAIMQQLLDKQRHKIDALERYAEATREYEVAEQRLRIFEEENNDQEANFRLVEDSYQSAKKTLTNIEKKLAEMKDRTNKKNAEARSLTENRTPNMADFPYREQFSSLPDTLEELQSHEDELCVRMECIAEGNPDVVEEYAVQKRRLDQLRTDVARTDRSTATLEKEMAELHARWYPEIQRVLSNINGKFSQFMSSMGFAGTVELIRNEERDYDEYGIQIFVKFRNEEKLSALDQKLQSGGERAVATAIYTLSLQHMTHVPFRCVDEINQGMDSTNERKVFNMLVDETCRDGESQYFFVTPKLVPGMKYNELMNVIIVHSGLFVEDSEMFLPIMRSNRE